MKSCLLYEMERSNNIASLDTLDLSPLWQISKPSVPKSSAVTLELEDVLIILNSITAIYITFSYVIQQRVMYRDIWLVTPDGRSLPEKIRGYLRVLMQLKESQLGAYFAH